MAEGVWGGGWGVAPWGGGNFVSLASTNEDFDVFCFSDTGMLGILVDPNVSTEGNGTQFSFDLGTADLEIASGVTATDDARLIVTANIPQTFTVEWIVRFNDLPTDFTDLTNCHIYLGCTDAAGPLVGLFFSKIGMAYTGSVSFPGGNLQLDTTFQVVPGSASYVDEDEYLVIRVAADQVSGIVYLYVTAFDELSTSGHVLRAIMPVIPYDAAATPPTDQALVSVRGTGPQPSSLQLDTFCVGTGLFIPNLSPVADAGADQAVRMCSIVRLNGAQSFDPEEAPLLYQWRLIEAPPTSEFSEQFSDGFTLPDAPPTGFTDKFYSVELVVEEGLDPFDVGGDGDVLLVRGEAYTIIAKGTDGSGFFVQIGTSILPDDLSVEPFKVLRQRGLSGETTVAPTFFPDVPGFYKFDLVVFDGGLFSKASSVLVNVLETPLPRGCTPDLSFIFTYLSDFWGLVEDRDRLEVFWSGLAQVTATELYSLWQVEYSKSLRDVQRVFVRRWLHYPLLLAEPLPELTRVRAIFGGVTSSFIPAGGSGGINATTLTVSAETLATEVTITVKALNPVTAGALAIDLQRQLRAKADSRFTVRVIENRTANTFAVRIDAPFPFEIVAGSCPVFSSVEARPPSGTGNGVGSRLYKVDRSLEGLGLQEDDFLVLNGVAYRIARVLDDAADDLPFQRLLLKEDLPTVPSTSWAVSGWVSSELLDFYAGLVSRGDFVDFEIADIGEDASGSAIIVASSVLGVSATFTSRVAVDMWPIGTGVADGGKTVFLARVLRQTYVPVHELVVDVPVLQELIEPADDTAVLRRNVDFFVETFRGQKALRFSSGQDGGPSVWEDTRPPHRLWAEYTYLDNRPTIEANFGIPVGLTVDQLGDLPDNVDYLSAVRGLWYAFFNGPTLRNLRVGTQILLGLPFAEEEGTIEEIRTDFSSTSGRILIRDKANTALVRSYQFPRSLDLELNPDTQERYKVGDVVARFAPLVEGAEVIDYVKDADWFKGLLNQGVFFEVEKFHKFIVRVNEAAFSLNTLLFVRNFILKIKPNYTYPLFIVQRNIAETEVSTTDDVKITGRLMLFDSVCENMLGSAFMFDEPRAGGGGWRSAFDSDAVPLVPNGDPDPVWPTSDPDNEILWGFDREQLCPEDDVDFIICQTFAAPFDIPFDSVFFFDTPIQQHLLFAQYTPPAIPIPPAMFAIPAVAGSTAPFTGTISRLRFYFQGNPGASPTDYEVVLSVGGSPVSVHAFTAGFNTEVIASINIPVISGQAIAVSIRAASGAAIRNPAWSEMSARLTFNDSAEWEFDDTLAAGTYCAEVV